MSQQLQQASFAYVQAVYESEFGNNTFSNYEWEGTDDELKELMISAIKSGKALTPGQLGIADDSDIPLDTLL